MHPPKQHHRVDYIDRLKNGDETAFDFFFREYYAALCYYSFQVTRSKADAEEIAGNSLVKFWERRMRFDSLAAIRSFLYTSAKNESLNCVRNRQRAARNIKASAVFSDLSEKNNFERLVETETYREIVVALETLPPQCKKIFSMLFLQGKSYQQIASELQVSVATVRSQKARAIGLLRKKLSSYGMIALTTLVTCKDSY
jgi:RNA polymerase sigma-70 factor (family 1)